MNRQALIIIAAMLICLPTAAQTQTKPNDNVTVPTITVTKLDVTDKALNLSYEIRNDSDADAWILVGWYQFSRGTFGMGAWVQMDEDGHTLTIRARFNSPTTEMGIEPDYGRFVRLRQGDSQIESIFVRLPAYPPPQLDRLGQQEQGVKHATRLAIELGYYRGDLPERILKTLKPPENIFPKDPSNFPASRDVFSRWNERFASTDDELLIPEGSREFKNEDEQLIRTVTENVSIPYEEKRDYTKKIESPGLSSYEKIELQYKPSMLEYFFPYESQQSLLSADEMAYLKSDKTIVLNDRQDIRTIASYIPHSRASTTVIVGIPVR